MNIKKYIFSVKSKNNSKTIHNPYVKGAEGRREWNDRYLNLSESARVWRIMGFVSLSAVILLAIIIMILLSQSRIQPYVIETNQGTPIQIDPVSAISQHDKRLILFAMNQFILNSRTIVNDTATQKALLNKVYAYAANNTLTTLRDYYKNANPFELSNQYTVSIDIINSMSLTDNAWQIIWDEVKHNSSGVEVGTTRFIANLTYKFGEVNSKFLNDNPFGLYVTDIAWSQNQERSVA
jgi:type IV secretory pathway TrbF-like protein